MEANKHNLTAKQQALKAEVDKQQNEFERLDQQRNIALTSLARLRIRCAEMGHTVPERATYNESEDAISGSAVCAVCGPMLTWYCPKNPQHYCEYDDAHGECCIHCDLPMIRK